MLFRIIILLLILVPQFIFAQAGKIIGSISDAKSGEPLVGANILIEGTFLGGATDINGEYIILNVPPGTYTVKALYVGYRDLIVENIKVSANLTTNLDLQLETDELTTEVITIVAEKPLVNKNITNSNNIVRAEDIKNLPVRSVNNIVATEAGVVERGGNLYVRGSRQDAVAYYVDGVLVNDPVFGGSQTALIANAIEEIQFQAGGYSAEFGGANGGIISTSSKAGSEDYTFNVELITDNFQKVGEKYLGGYSYGQSEYILTAGGPVIPDYKNLKFFVAINNDYKRSPAAFVQGVNIVSIAGHESDGIYDPSLGSLADTIRATHPAGYQLHQQENTYNVQGNLSWNLNPFTIRLNGSFKHLEGESGYLGNAIRYRESDAYGINEQQTITTSLKLTHVINPNAYYDVILNYYNDFYVDMDPVFKHDLAAYGDSALNAPLGHVMSADGQEPISRYAYGFEFKSPQPYNNYAKQRTEQIGGKLNLLYQVGKHHELKTGGEVNTYIIRRYAIGPRAIAGNARSVADGSVYGIYSRVDNYGYDVYGNATESGLTGPRKPVFAGAYLQDKMEFADLVVNAGVRLDYIDINDKEFITPDSVTFVEGDQIDPNALKDVKPRTYFSPRLGFSFPVTDKTIFHAQYGKFVQQSRLRDIYQGYNLTADNIKGGFAISAPVGNGLKPEKTTSYEIGFKQQLGDVFAFDITAFYKHIKDQIQIRSVYAASGASHRQYYSFQNGDFATTKGLEIKLDLRRTNRMSGSFDYTYSTALGTGSNPSTGFRMIWQAPPGTNGDQPYFPQQIAPLDFNQTHRGTISLDYRFAKNDGPSLFGAQFLQEAGLNLLFSFNSGTNFTRWEGYFNSREPLEPLNSSTTPWVFQLDARLDKTFSFEGLFDLNFYVWVVNLFNRQNVINVFNNTGDGFDDGWLTSPSGRARIDGYTKSYGPEYADTYKKLYSAITYDSDNFGTPRQIRLGLRVDF